MPANKFDSLRESVTAGIDAASADIAAQWLEGLAEIIDENVREIFPTDLILDHIPSLIEELAKVITKPDNLVAISSSLIKSKAMTLAHLRHEQNATVHQLLREYDILSNLIEDHVAVEISRYNGEYEIQDVVDLMHDIAAVIRTLLQATVDSFVDLYMQTIDQQTDKLMMFNQFLSHELRKPLQAALLNSELLLEEKSLADEDVSELLLIKNSIQQASTLLKDIEQLGQTVEDIYDSPVVQEVNLNNLVNDIESQMEEMLNTYNVSMKIDGDLGSVATKPGKLELILTNLLSNAVKYSDSQKDELWIKISMLCDDSTETLSLTIEDNGLGISKDMQDEIFKIRVRAHDELDQVEGHGLGLYLAREAAQSIGASISLTSEEQQGSRFVINLPLKIEAVN